MYVGVCVKNGRNYDKAEFAGIPGEVETPAVGTFYLLLLIQDRWNTKRGQRTQQCKDQGRGCVPTALGICFLFLHVFTTASHPALVKPSLRWLHTSVIAPRERGSHLHPCQEHGVPLPSPPTPCYLQINERCSLMKLKNRTKLKVKIITKEVNLSSLIYECLPQLQENNQRLQKKGKNLLFNMD